MQQVIIDIFILRALIVILAIIIEPLTSFVFIKYHPLQIFGLLVNLTKKKHFLKKPAGENASLSSFRKKQGLRLLLGSEFALICVAVVIILLLGIFNDSIYGIIFSAIIVAISLCGTLLYFRVKNIEYYLKNNRLDIAREELIHLVGRDVYALDEQDCSAASIESLAESFNDGVIAPIIYYLFFGFTGLFIYKGANTLDSMVGYKSEKYLDYGSFSAKFDDILNYIPARISASLFYLAYPKLINIGLLYKNAKNHDSPNAGYPEAALALILNIRLNEAKLYPKDSKYASTQSAENTVMNFSAPAPTNHKIIQALALYGRTILLVLIILALIFISGYFF